MRKIFSVVGITILLSCVFVSNSFPADFILWGTPGATKKVYVDNVARTLRSTYERGGGTWIYTDASGTKRTPYRMFITCEGSKKIRWAFGGTTPEIDNTVGHAFPENGSWPLPGERYLESAIVISAVATDNVVCQETPEYMAY